LYENRLTPAKGNAVQREDLGRYFEQLLSPALFDDYAPNGLQVEGKERVKKVAFAVSATLESIEAAAAWGADTLVVHHGIFWKHQGARPLVGAWGKRARTLIQYGINLYGYHLPLDAHMEVGNAVALARAAGFLQAAPFGLHKKQYLGVSVTLATPMTARALQDHLAKVLAHPVLLASADENATVRTLGIITGGANQDWVQAHNAGLDAYLTGEISEYNWHDAREAGLHYFAGGHHATERFGVQALMARMLRDQAGLEAKFFDSANPA
jgi:dinuclear metal center YbgI/SA1388 family protein